MEKRWVVKEEPDKGIVDALSKSINVNEYLGKILVQRGIDSFDKAKEFFRPNLDMLHDPFEMKGMHTAINRLSDAVFHNEKILLYGDYDVDGTTSVSLLFMFLSQFTEKVEYYIPDRYTEGYGVSQKGISYAINEAFDLIITLDCGIRAVERINTANNAGIDVIICDHHIPGDLLPNALAILDPKQVDCQYPFKELSGCGVGFKLLEGFCYQNTIDKNKLFGYLDLVAVSIASDIVPIVDENRVLAFYGLKKLNEQPSAGLQSLIEIANRKPPLSITDVVFSIGPRINATGRLTHAKESVNLLIGKPINTVALAENLNERNAERRELDRTITQEALEMIEKSTTRCSSVLFKDSWHKGVVGIVASRCIEYYHRPTIVLTESKGKATGSARSVDGFDVYQAICQCENFLDQFGGHTHAAGLTMPLENVDAFRDKFEEVVASRILPEQLIPKISIDTFIPLSYLTFKMASIIYQMEPCGPENMHPVFGTKNVYFKNEPTVLKGKHLKGFLTEMGNERAYEFIGFGLAHKIEGMDISQPFQVAYHLEENEYLGNRTLSINLKDLVFDA